MYINMATYVYLCIMLCFGLFHRPDPKRPFRPEKPAKEHLNLGDVLKSFGRLISSLEAGRHQQQEHGQA